MDNRAAKRVLFVDDEASIRATLPPVLEKAGFEVRVAESVSDAIFEINSHQFDALITDLNIGEEGDGFLVASSMRHIQPHCATFILTGYPAFETALQAIHSQVDDYLVKPVEVESLLSALNENTRRAASVKRLPVLLQENREQITEQFVASTKQHSDHDSASPEELLRHLLGCLEAVAQQGQREQDNLAEDGLRCGRDFGRWRRENGGSLSAMFKDFRVLYEVLYQVVQSNLAELELVTLIADLRRVNLGVNLLAEQAVAAFGPGGSEKSTRG